MRRLLLLIGCVAASPAFATGGFSCSIDDAVLTLDVESNFSYGLGGPFVNFHGELAVSDRRLPAAGRARTLDAAALPHHWLYDGELRLRIYAEFPGEPFGAADLAIVTRQSPTDEVLYEGDYRLSLFIRKSADASGETVEKRGKVSCSVG